MRDDGKAKRQAQIEQAAYDVMEDKGYAGTSMLAIARRARASNETLYNWYGDKTGLFRALVRRNAAEVTALLDAQIDAADSVSTTLRRVGPMLLELVTSDRAVALGRAAAADATGTLGRAISDEGRGSVAPRIATLLERGRQEGMFDFEDADTACETYLSLLIGDLQIRRVVGRMPQPDAAARIGRAETALRQFAKLHAP